MTDQYKANLAIRLFEEQSSWEAWLKANHTESRGIWIKIAKIDTEIASVDYAEAVESALCYGWIDSQKASFDDQYFLQKFSPRQPKSKWSKGNRAKAEALIAAGRMQPAGYHQVELAKEDGRWADAYDPQSQIAIPDDFQTALEKNHKAKEFFSTLNSINRHAILHRIQVAKKPETRTARIRKCIEMLAKNKKIYP
jgi:uncharacterized protein YdeI (YjbR/CyaY-like superfamily)